MQARGAVAVFHVRDLEASLRYYTTVFGFAEEFRRGDYAAVKQGPLSLHLSAQNVHNRPIGGGTVYVFCDEVDAYYAELKSRGAVLKGEPQDTFYGMRDFMSVDPDGNHIAFGCALAKV